MMGSPLNYFDANTGGRQGMFQMGAQIGALNSPASGPTSAIKQVLERARAWTDRQQTQEYAMQLEKSKFGMGQGLKTQYATQAQSALDGLRDLEGEENGMIYQNGVRLMRSPSGNNQWMMSNATADETNGIASWGPFSPTTTQDPMTAGVNQKVSEIMPGPKPTVSGPLRKRSQQPAVIATPESTIAPQMTATEKRIEALMQKLSQ